jgi:ligand-binding SRPBCC domain-containing protein
MPRFEASQCFARPVAEVFDFFRRPANLVKVSPPELHLRLVEGPEVLERGSRIVFQGRRWGLSQRVVSEVTAFELNAQIIDAQREGPFRQWVHTHRFETVPEGTRVIDQIDYEPPSGILGLVVTAAFIERDLRWIFDYRRKKLEELLGSGIEPARSAGDGAT